MARNIAPKRKTRKAESTAGSGSEMPRVEVIPAAEAEAMERVAAASLAMVTGATRTQREIVSFVSERIRQDVETQTALMRCRNLGEVQSVQGRFLHTAAEQYAETARRLMQVNAEMMHGSFESLRP